MDGWEDRKQYKSRYGKSRQESIHEENPQEFQKLLKGIRIRGYFDQTMEDY
jgi:hypothetical protein